jgi:hypothetical protein
MDITELLEPVLTNGIRVNHFFNGRVLTAEDLRAEQQANREQHRQLARAIGEGVVHGLDVSARTAADGTPLLRVTAGLALNRDGDAVALGRRVDVRLVPAQEAESAEAGLFAVCVRPARTLDLTNVGLYVLAISPASALSTERAPAAEFSAEGVASSCASRWAQEGARFAVAPLPLAAAGTTPTALAAELADVAESVEEDVELVLRGGASDTPAVRDRLRRNLSLLRNGAAYLCFGTESDAARLANPVLDDLGARTYGALDGMRERGDLGACEVPLALLYISRRGIEWVDAWAVRRSPVPVPGAGEISLLPVARRLGEAMAMVLQFQQQMAEMVASDLSAAALTTLEARARFRFLPPCGLVPLRLAGVGRGMGADAFFRGLALGAAQPVGGSRLGRILSGALLHPPVDLSASTAALLLFRPRENQASGVITPYVAFVTRESVGPVVRDRVAGVLGEAWDVYRGVIRRRLFLPLASTADTVAAQLTITSAVRDVMEMASRQAAVAAAGLDVPDALEALREIHRVQNDLAVLLRGSIPGITNPQGRVTFGDGLHARLNTSLPGGARALLPAIQAGDLAGAVAAQGAINIFVGSWSGEGIAVGPLLVEHVESPRGLNVVPGDEQGFPHHFRVRNGADRRLQISLEGSASAPNGDWSDRVRVEATNGTALTTLDLAPGASATVVVRVGAPSSGTVEGDTVVLRLRATVPPPNDRDVSATQELTVASTPGGAVQGSVRVIAPSPMPGNLDNAPPSNALGFLFHFRYTAPDTAPPTAQFTLRVTVEAADVTLWPVEFADVPGANPSPGVYTRSPPLARGVQAPAEFLIGTPPRSPSADRTATVRVRVESTSLPTTVSDGLDTPIAIRVRLP